MVDLFTHADLHVAQFRIAGRGDAPLVPGDQAFAVDAAVAVPRSDEQFDDEIGRALEAARERLDVADALAHRVEFPLAVVVDRACDEVVERFEVVGGRRERQARAGGDGPVPDGVDPPFEDEVGRCLDQRLTAPFALRGRSNRHLLMVTVPSVSPGENGIGDQPVPLRPPARVESSAAPPRE